jgi:hypothetical protein
MQDDDFDPTRLDPQGDEATCPKSRTTAFLSRSCERCGKGLTGRKKRFCSDRCRIRFRRAKELTGLKHLIARLQDAVNDVALALVGKDVSDE